MCEKDAVGDTVPPFRSLSSPKLKIVVRKFLKSRFWLSFSGAEFLFDACSRPDEAARQRIESVDRQERLQWREDEQKEEG